MESQLAGSEAEEKPRSGHTTRCQKPGWKAHMLELGLVDLCSWVEVATELPEGEFRRSSRCFG
jgi:hypothetical protein